MAFIKNFLYFLSGTNAKIMGEIEKDFPYERNKRLNLGIMILFSSFLIILSSFFVINQIFNNYLWAFLVCIPFNISLILINSYLIATIRKADFASNFVIALPRLILSVIISFVISFPLEMRLFEREIDYYILSEIKSSVRDDIEIQDYERQIDEYQRNLSSLQEKYLTEISGEEGTKKSGVGPAALFIKRELDKVEANLLEAQQRRNDLIKQNTELLTKQNNSFFSRVTAIQALRKENNNVYFISWVLFLIVFSTEISPLVIFWATPRGPYDALLDNLLFEEKDEIKFEEKKINSRIKLPTFKEGFFTLFDSDDSFEKLDEIQSDTEAIKNDREFVMKDWKNVLKKYGTR